MGCRILVYREKTIIGEDLDHKNGRFLCQMITYDKGVSIVCFFFLPSKHLKKHI